MNKLYFLVKQKDEAFLDSQKLLDDEDLFGSMKGVFWSNCNQELDEVWRKRYKKEWWDSQVRLDEFQDRHVFLYYNFLVS